MDTMIQTDIEDPEYLGKVAQPRAPQVEGIGISNRLFAVALSRAISVAGRGETMPILNCVLLSVSDGKMAITANNMEQALKQEIPVSGLGRGSGCVKAAMLLSIISKLPPEAATTLEFGEVALTLRCQRSRATLELLPEVNYPTFTTGHSPCNFAMRCADLLHLINRIRPFISREETRYYLCGIHLECHAADGVKTLRASATDGAWLGMAHMALPSGGEQLPENTIIPTVSVDILVKLLESGGDINVSASDTRMIFEVGGVTFATKLIDGNYPDIDRVIPKRGDKNLRIQRPALLTVLSLMSVQMDDWNIVLVLDMSRDTIKITSGTGANQIVCELPDGSFVYEGDPLRIAFQNKFLVEPAKLAKDAITFNMIDAESFVTAQNADDDTATYIIRSYRI